MDKIKLFTNQKSHLPKQIIENEFSFMGSSYDNLKHNNRLKYSNDKVRLTIDKYGLQLITNPTNYLKDNNAKQINRSELIDFKQAFEQDFRTNTNNYTLTGFDYNVNILTDYPVGSYLRSFDNLPKYKKESYANGCGITYLNQCKSFSIYDKIKQMEQSAISLPPDYAGVNVMRLELGVKSRLNKTKNLHKINTLHDLTLRDNYISMIGEYENIYSKINKQPILKFTDMNKPHPSIMSTDDFLIIFFINEVGFDNYLHKLEQERMMGIISPKQVRTRKIKAMALWNQYCLLDGNGYDLFKEMNDKVIDKIQENKELALS